MIDDFCYELEVHLVRDREFYIPSASGRRLKLEGPPRRAVVPGGTEAHRSPRWSPVPNGARISCCTALDPVGSNKGWTIGTDPGVIFGALVSLAIAEPSPTGSDRKTGNPRGRCQVQTQWGLDPLRDDRTAGAVAQRVGSNTGKRLGDNTVRDCVLVLMYMHVGQPVVEKRQFVKRAGVS